MSSSVILDTDIGSDVDDAMALALILGTESVDLRSVTTVYGDTALRARIARRYGRLAGRELDVYAGIGTPMSGKDVWWAGHEGSLHPGLDSETFGPADAVDVLVDTVIANPGTVDVFGIGPLTNIAAAIQRDDRFASSVRGLWLMGGAFDPAPERAEHNIVSDADAAAIVFGSGAPITVAGLEVTRNVTITAPQLDRIAAAGDIGSALAADIAQWWAFWNETWNVPHDPVTVLTLTAPELFELSDPGTVDVGAGGIEGSTAFTPGGGNVRVVTALDTAAVAERIVAGIEAAALRTRTER